MSANLFLNFLSLHGRLFGLYRNIVNTGDAWLGGDGFQSTLESTADTLTAHAGGGQASGLPLTAVINRVTTVGTAADSVVLPVSRAGMTITVINAAAANSMNVFPNAGGTGTETINALAANAAFAVAANKTAYFTCATPGQWHSVLTA